MSLDAMIEKSKSNPEFIKKHAKLNLLIAKKFSEIDQIFNKECLRLIIKIFSGYIEKYQDNFDFVFLVLKQVITNYIEKSKSSQDITDYVFPLIHLLSSINLNKQKDIVAYADLHKTLLACVKKLLLNKHLVAEHKEILFNSVVLPGIEELKAILVSTRQVDVLDRIKLQSVMMIELIESFANEQQIEKFMLSVIEGLRIDNFLNNKCYVNEMLIVLALETIKLINSGNFSISLVLLFTNKFIYLLDNSEQYCKEFKTFNTNIINKQTPIDQINSKVSQTNGIIDRIKLIHNFYKIDQLGFEGIFKEKELLLEAIAANSYIKDGFYNNPAFVIIRTIDFLLSNYYSILDHKFIDKIKVWLEISLSIIEDTIERLVGNIFESAVLSLYLRSLFLKFLLKYLKFKPEILKEIDSKGSLVKRKKTIESLKNFFSNPKFRTTPKKETFNKNAWDEINDIKKVKTRKFSEKLSPLPYDIIKTPLSRAYFTDKDKKFDNIKNRIDEESSDEQEQWRLNSKIETEYIDTIKTVMKTQSEYIETAEQLKKSKYGSKLYSKALCSIYDIQIAKQFICLLIVPQLLERKPYKIGQISYTQLILDLISFIECDSNICGVEEERLVKGTVDVKETRDILRKAIFKKIIE